MERPMLSVSEILPAMPKSVSPGIPYAFVRTLAGLMSRCRMPARCAVSTADPIWIPSRRVSSTLSGRDVIRSARLG